jgi:transcriptional regulator with XRE-family HTH domain
VTGAELAAGRKRAGLSQTELARQAGCGRHAVSYWECKPVVDLRAWAIERMATVLDLPDTPAVTRARAAWADMLAAEDAAREAAFLAHVRRLHMQCETVRAKRRVIWGARTCKGTACRAMSEPGRRRCKFHGGKSTGARTPEGIERIREAQWQRWARWRLCLKEGDKTRRFRPRPRHGLLVPRRFERQSKPLCSMACHFENPTIKPDFVDARKRLPAPVPMPKAGRIEHTPPRGIAMRSSANGTADVFGGCVRRRRLSSFKFKDVWRRGSPENKCTKLLYLIKKNFG